MRLLLWLVNYSKYTLSSIVYSHIHCCGGTLCLIPQDGWSALMLASDSGHTEVVQLLLSSGAKVDLQSKVRHSINL